VVTIAVGTYPSAVGVTLDGSKVYVVRDGAGQLLVIDAATHAITATVPVPVSSLIGTGAVAFTPDGTRAYVVSAGVATVIDTATNAVVTSFTPGAMTARAAVSPDGSMVYFVNGFDGTVTAFDTATHTHQGTTLVGGLPHGVVIARDGVHAFVTVPAR